jgi:DNA-binding transcriptional MerR regulator
MNVPAERLLDELQISSAQLRDFEDKGIVQGMLKAGRIFYSPRDVYRIKGILLYMTRGLPLEKQSGALITRRGNRWLRKIENSSGEG